MRRSEMKMIEQAARQRWQVSTEYRSQAVETLMKILGSVESSDREKIAATRALVAMDVLNQKDEHAEQLKSDRNRFLEIAQRLGIRESVEPVAKIGTDHVVEGIVSRPKRERQRPKKKKSAKKRGSRGNNKPNR